MKKLFNTLLLCLISMIILGQAPQIFNYQAVLRNIAGEPIDSQDVTVRIDILKGNALGPQIFTETHNATTNEFGLVNLRIGSIHSLEVVNWSIDDYFIQVFVDGTIMGTTQLLSVPYALHAKTVEENDVKTYEIGDFAYGGIVFWVDETGQHGLVCAKEDQSSGIRWNAGTFGDTRACGDGLFAGKMNTAIIIAAHVAIGDDGGTYAARICNELQITEGGNTYGDWYLPSREELALMYVNKATIDATAIANGGSAFYGDYWSSFENSGHLALVMYFNNDGGLGYRGKNNTARVRAIRAF